jgi:hypothetical protein
MIDLFSADSFESEGSNKALAEKGNALVAGAIGGGLSKGEFGLMSKGFAIWLPRVSGTLAWIVADLYEYLVDHSSKNLLHQFGSKLKQQIHSRKHR